MPTNPGLTTLEPGGGGGWLGARITSRGLTVPSFSGGPATRAGQPGGGGGGGGQPPRIWPGMTLGGLGPALIWGGNGRGGASSSSILTEPE